MNVRKRTGSGAGRSERQPDRAQDNSEEIEPTYSSDEPIQFAANDRFGRATFCKRIAETIFSRQETSSLVIGLSGPWGDGKTSALFMIEEELRSHRNIIVVRFNPWHFTTEDQLIRAFFETLSSGIGKKLNSTKEGVGKALKDYGAFLSIASFSIGGGVVSIDPGQAAERLGNSLSTASLDDLKSRVEAGLAAEGKKVVVFIDDIDRLDRSETHAVFKLVKLSAGFERTTYVLAFDEDIVSAALGERYGEGQPSAGKSFLEKIIQVPLHLPPADATALCSLAFEGVNSALHQASIVLSKNQADQFSIQFIQGLAPALRTPRHARLYSNALMFSLPIVNGEVNIVDFMLVEGIRTFYPKLYRSIRDDPGPWTSETLRGGKNRSEEINRILSATVTGRPEDIKYLQGGLLLHLFPRSGNSSYGGDWEPIWSGQKRLCAQGYFRRYFSYGTPPNDISDRAIETLLESATHLKTDEVREKSRDLMSSNAHIFVQRLRRSEDSLSEAQSITLLAALAPLASCATVERGPLVVVTTRLQLAVLFSKLLIRVESGPRRTAVAHTLATEASPLPFAVDCLRWMAPNRSRDEGNPAALIDPTQIVSDTDLASLAGIVVSRAAAEDDLEPLYRRFGADAKTVYWLWQEHAPNELRERIALNLRLRPDEVDHFLEIFVGESWGLESGLPSRGDLRRDAYNTLSDFVDPDFIAALLHERYGSRLDHPAFDLDETSEPALRLANQFMVLHESSDSGNQKKAR